jgi:hypothetical protein
LAPKHVCSKEIRLCAQNMLTILNSIVNLIREDLYDHWHENLHFDNEWDSHSSSENYEANIYRKDLELLINLNWLRVTYPTRCGCREKSIHLRHVYLRWCSMNLLVRSNFLLVNNCPGLRSFDLILCVATGLLDVCCTVAGCLCSSNFHRPLISSVVEQSYHCMEDDVLLH